MHTHFLRDDTRIMTFVDMRKAVGKAGWNKQLGDHEQTIEDLKFNNYKKEMFLDSDTKISLISSRAVRHRAGLVPDQRADGATRARRSTTRPARAGCSAHMIFTPGQPGWLDKLDAGARRSSPKSCKGYTIGDNTHKEISRYPWRMDDEKVAYKGYEKMVKAGIKNVCVHKGLFPPGDREAVSRTCAASPTSPTSARRQRTGRSSISSSITRPIAMSAATRKAGAGRVRAHRADFLDQRPRRHPGAVRRQQCLWRRRAVVRDHAGGGAECLRRADGHA